MILQTTETGEAHGLINVLANNVKDTDFAHLPEEYREKARKQRKHDSKRVKARYINYLGYNERLTKPYCKYAGDKIEIYHLIPGREYELPLGMIEEINACEGIPVRGERVEDKMYIAKDQRPNKIHELVPVSF